MKHGDHEYTSYRGFRLKVENQRVVIFDGRRELCAVPTMSGARSFVKGYRRAERMA